jgi:hypothetical protein
MHLSPYQTAIEVAYQALLHDIALRSTRPEYAFNFIQRRPAHVLPRQRPHPTIPIPVKEYDPMESVTPFAAKEKMVQLAAFQSTFHGSVTPFSLDIVPLILDTGASVSISPCRTDFISPIRPAQHITIKGVASGLNVAGTGNMAYTFINDAGDTQTITLKNSLYVPQSALRLICPRQIGASTGHHADGLYATAARSHLIVEGQLTTLAYDHLSQLPVLFTKPGITTYLNFVENLHAFHNAPSSTNSLADNLTKRQRQKLYLHELSAHEGFKNLNHWIRKGVFPGVDPTLSQEPDPICSACAFGKARRLSHKTHTGHISSQHTIPGQGISADGMESSTPGRPFTTNGSPSKLRYNFVSFWIDHMSSYVYVTFHASKATTELVHSKTEFEQFALRYGVSIKNIRADNGVYLAQLFKDSCMKHQQNLTFCAVGAHWQNGVTERFIGTITQWARTILLHAMSKWPAVITEDMWTFALRHAVNFHNSSVCKAKCITPHEAFTGETPPWAISDFRVFGSSTYILKKELQDGSSIGRWKPRCWPGVYIGTSTCHSSAIPLIYNPRTTDVSPQFHVLYDEYFHTVNSPASTGPMPYLEKLFNTTAWWLYIDPYSPEPHLFETFWSGADPPTTTRKRKFTHLDSAPLQGSPKCTL